MAEPLDTGGNRLLGGLIAEGGDWPESRSFSRTYGHNPHAQAALVKALVGIWNTTGEAWEPNTEIGGAKMPKDEAHLAIEGTIRYMRERLPQWASLGPVVLDTDFGLPDYPGCDPFLKQYVEERVLKGVFDKGGVE